MNSATASCHDDQVDKELTDAGGRLPEATHVCDLTEQCASSSPAYIPDGGWGWFVVFSAFISEAFLDGLAVSVGVLLVTFKEYFDEEAGKVSLISSLGQFVFFCSCPISSSIGKHVGERRVAMIGGVMTSAGLVVSAFVTDVTMLYFTMSFLMNFGLSLSFLPSFSLLGKYFEKRHGLANALATAGYGLGIMGLPPLCQILIQGYGWRGTLIILSAMSANLSVAGALLRPLCSNEKIARQDGKSLDREHRCLRFVRLFGFHIIYLQPSIMGITLAIGFIGAASGIFITFFMQRLDEIGVDRVDASLLNTVVGAAALSIRLIYGWFIDLRVISPLSIVLGSVVTYSALLLTLVFITTYRELLILSVCIGLTCGLFNSLHFVIFKDAVERKHVASAFGLDLFAMGIGAAIGIAVSGALYDLTGTADVTFYTAAVFGLLSAASLIITKRHS